MKKYVGENDTARTWILVIVGVLCTVIILSCGMDKMLDFPMMPLLWATIMIDATAAGHLIWLLVSAFSEKNRFYTVLPLTCGGLGLISYIYSEIERHRNGFLSDLGAAIIILFFTLPLAAVTVFWIIAGIVHLVRSKKNT
ncbi:MAG: hypothetical protein J5501_08670 [Ruminococcus sp.]|nr:hypothetical protein [Ruminococcus sp.]